MFAGFVLLVIAMMKLFPELPTSRTLHRALVEAPLDRLAKMGRRHLIYAAVLVGMMFAGAEMVMLLGSADLMMLMAWDVSLYVDALIATWTLSAVMRGKAAWRTLAAPFFRPLRRAPRSRRRIVRKPAANDSEEGPGAYARAA